MITSEIIKVSNQAELNAAIAANPARIEIHGSWNDVIINGTVTGSICVYGTSKVGSIDVYGTVTGSICVSGTVTGSICVYGTGKVGSIYVSGTVTGSIDVYGTVTGSIYVSGTGKVGSICVSGTVTGSICVYGTGKVGSIYVSGTVTGSIDVYGTVTGSIYVSGTGKVGSIYVSGTVTGSIDVSGTGKVGSIYVSGTVTGSIDVYGTVTGSIYVEGEEKIYFGKTLREIETDHALVLAASDPNEIAALRAALVAGKINGHLYEGECTCLVGTLEKAGGRKLIPRNADRLAEKFYLAISKGHTPENNTFAKYAVRWIDKHLAARFQPATAVDISSTAPADSWVKMSERKPVEADYPVFAYDANYRGGGKNIWHLTGEPCVVRFTHWKAAEKIPTPPARELTQAEKDDAAYSAWIHVKNYTSSHADVWRAALAYERARVSAK